MPKQAYHQNKACKLITIIYNFNKKDTEGSWCFLRNFKINLTIKTLIAWGLLTFLLNLRYYEGYL